MARKPTNLKRKLIETGVSVVQSKGLNALSLREITKLCNVSHSSIYRYFGHKEDYVNAVIDKISISFGEYLIGNINKSDNVKLQLEIMGINFLNFAKRKTNLFNALFFRNQNYPIKPETTDYHSFLAYQKFTSIIKKLVIHEELSTAIVHLWSYIMGLAVLVSSHNLDINCDWIKNNIHQMIKIYFENKE